MITALLIVLLATLAYAWIGYPLVLAAMARCAAARGAAQGSALPGTISFLFSAHNEEGHIAARIANLCGAMEEAQSAGARCEVLVGVDGSDDRTADIARSWAADRPGIRVFESRERRGKIRMVKDLVNAASGEVLVLTDANTMFVPGSTVRLLRRFSDPGIGGVCGRLVLKEASGRGDMGIMGQEDCGTRRPWDKRTAGPGEAEMESSSASKTARSAGASHLRPSTCRKHSPEASYWDLESRLKTLESGLDSCLGANGAIYAIRRELFWRDVPDNTVVDDFVIGMKVREAGRRMVYEPEAVAEEELPEIAHEWRRRIRIGAGDFQAMALCARCLLPRHGFFAWAFWSHKILRWLTPHIALLAVFLGGLQFADSGFRVPGAGLSGILPLCILVAAPAGALAWVLGRLARAASLSRQGAVSLLLLWEHFVTMQAALFVGSLRYLRGDLKGHWTRTPRSGT